MCISEKERFTINLEEDVKSISFGHSKESFNIEMDTYCEVMLRVNKEIDRDEFNDRINEFVEDINKFINNGSS